MRRAMERVISRCGTTVCLETAAGKLETKALFRSINSDAWRSAEQVLTPLGLVGRGRYICLLPVTAAVSPGDTLTVDAENYLLRRVEKVRAFSKAVCQWCLCVEKGGAADDSYMDR